MKQKWERQPQRIGMVAGFVALPLLWWLQENLLHLFFGFRSPNDLELIGYFAVGAIPGAVLGAGVSRAIWASRKSDWRAVKRQMMGHSAFVLALFALLNAHYISRIAQNPSLKSFLFGFPVPVWLRAFGEIVISHLPFQCALLMFFLGLLMRARR